GFQSCLTHRQDWNPVPRPFPRPAFPTRRANRWRPRYDGGVLVTMPGGRSAPGPRYPGDRQVMSQLYRCANGHEWEAPVGDAISPCPVCGSLARTLPTAPTIDFAPSGTAPAGGRAAQENPSVGGYEVLGELGRGGMGIVYQARD